MPSTAQRTLEEEITSLAKLAAEEGLSDLYDHIEGVSESGWNFSRVRDELEQLTRYSGSVASRASAALQRLNHLI